MASITTLRAEYEAAKSALYARAPKADAEHAVWMAESSWATSYKVGGAAWLKGCILSVTRWQPHPDMVFLPPSDETVAWGGFLGGEWVRKAA